MGSFFCKAAFVWAVIAACLVSVTPAGAASPFDDAVAYWAFEEGFGSVIGDSKAAPADMIVADNDTPAWITGLVGGGVQVNPGNQKYITTGADADKLDFNRETSDAFSVAGWVKSYDGCPLFIKMEDSGNLRGWSLEVADNTTPRVNFLLRSTNDQNDKIQITSKGPVPMGDWTHFAATFSYNADDPMRGMRVYVNGYLQDMNVNYTGLADGGLSLNTTNDKPFQFTARDTREYLNVYETCYDEVGVWNRVLSQAEVQQLVNAGVPDVPVTNYIQNGNFEDTTGWVPHGAGVLPPASWESHMWKNNPADQAIGTAAVGGEGNSALLVDAHSTSGVNRPGMAQSFVHATDPNWQFDMDFATEPSTTAGERTVAFYLRTNNGAQLAFIVTDPDSDGLGDLMVGGASVYELIPAFEDKIVCDNDLSDLTGSVHHLKINGHFGDATPNYDIALTDPSGMKYTATGLTAYSGDMGTLVSGAGIMQAGFYTYKSYGDWVIDNVSLIDVAYVPGDATGNGVVDDADAAILAQYWGSNGAEIGWSQGDFNNDHKVDAADAAILTANYGYGTAEGGTAVPEPSALVLALTLALLTLATTRRQR